MPNVPLEIWQYPWYATAVRGWKSIGGRGDFQRGEGGTSDEFYHTQRHHLHIGAFCCMNVAGIAMFRDRKSSGASTMNASDIFNAGASACESISQGPKLAWCRWHLFGGRVDFRSLPGFASKCYDIFLRKRLRILDFTEKLIAPCPFSRIIHAPFCPLKGTFLKVPEIAV